MYIHRNSIEIFLPPSLNLIRIEFLIALFYTRRIILPSYQRVATLKQTAEEKIGLPAKPKRPITAYFRFMKHMRPEIVGKNPNLKLVEITKLLAQEWQKADANVKEKFEKEYQKSYQEYQTAKTTYLSSITDEQKKLIENAKNEAQFLKEKRLHKQVHSLLRLSFSFNRCSAIFYKQKSKKKINIHL